MAKSNTNWAGMPVLLEGGQQLFGNTIKSNIILHVIYLFYLSNFILFGFI